MAQYKSRLPRERDLATTNHAAVLPPNNHALPLLVAAYPMEQYRAQKASNEPFIVSASDWLAHVTVASSKMVAVAEGKGRRKVPEWLRLLQLCTLLLGSVTGDQTEEYLKREHSLSKPYQSVGSSASSLWDLMGNVLVTPQYVRLTPDQQSKQGAVWNRMPCYLRDWELQVHFKVHGQGKKNLNGDGFAIWYAKDRMQPGSVFGNKDHFVGLGVFIDTYPNEEKQHEKKRYSAGNQRVFPYASAMVSNGSLTYDHSRDGRPTELGGCTAMVRNLDHDTFLVVRYVKRRLTIMLDIDGKQEWRDCLDIPGVRLPRGYYFGTSAVTGDLSDNHDIISLKVYQLSVERTPAEEKMDKEVFIPSVDNMKLPGDDDSSEPMSSFAIFLIVFFSLLGLVFAGVILLIVYNKWQERSRKHFY